MADTDPWRDIVREALGDAQKALIGTHFRTAVDKVASVRGLRFPPKNEPELRFIELLLRFPETVSIVRRPGQDFLVIPPGRDDLATKQIEGRSFGIRRDFFDAFTHVSEAAQPHYNKASDTIAWCKAGETQTDDLIPIEKTSFNNQIKLRSEFAETVTQPEIKATLHEKLKSQFPLNAFSTSIRQAGLQREWHAFRTERLIDAIQRWAKNAGLDWKDSWLTDRSAERTAKSSAELASSRNPRIQYDPLHALFERLDAADIQRISIPLDLVLKALSSSGKR